MTKTSLKDLTLTEAIDALNKAVDIRGVDFIYPESEKRAISAQDPNYKACVYTREVDHKLVGSCIVGVTLIDVLGVDAEVLDAVYDSSGEALRIVGVNSVLISEIYRLAQIKQDQGHPWGVARDFALNRYQKDIAEALASEAESE